MAQKATKKKKIIIIAVISAVIALIAGVGVFLFMNPQYMFVIGEYFGVRCDKAELTATEPDGLSRTALDELADDSRVRFDQSLMLVNTDHMLDDGFTADTVPYGDTGVIMNECMTDAFAALSAAITEKTGERLLVSSDFRTTEQQEAEYEDAPSVATKPGASEHQTGLALDVYVKYYASYGFLKNEAGRFCDAECWKYGFIVRYPVFGKNETGIVFEPWHIRYVGEPHAKIIYNNRLTLEEYVTSFEVGKWYSFDGYLISRQDTRDGAVTLPSEFRECVISPDNTGYSIITVLI